MVGEKAQIFSTEMVDERGATVVITSSATDLTYTIKPSEQIVRVAQVGAYNMTLTLPSLADAAGRFYSIRVISRSSGHVYVADAGDEPTFPVTNAGSIDLDAAREGVLLYSDGHNWWFCASEGLACTTFD
jgi:hypothetical protein